VTPHSHRPTTLTLFCPQVVPGETALAFYRAKNPTDKPIIGISTYNVVPFDAGQYFNKIQVSFRLSCWTAAGCRHLTAPRQQQSETG